MRPDYIGILFLSSAVVSFNAGIWQVFRRREKKQLLENHKNLSKAPLTSLPDDNTNCNDYEYRRVVVEGTLDNEGSVLVGPRAIPSFKGAANADESKGGFLILTPFEIAETGQYVMVNRGWVPIDAGKHRKMLTQYIGEGFAPLVLQGMLRREEYMSRSALLGESPDNTAPVVADLSWLVIRPWNMMASYYAKRFGAQHAAKAEEEHGLHHYYVEMIENFSGDDQRMVRGHPWPRRRELEEIIYVHLTPIVHSMYVFFWFSVTIGSLYGMRKCWQRQQELFALRKVATRQSTLLEKKRQEEATAFFEAAKNVEQLKLARKQHLLGQAKITAAATPGSEAEKGP